MGNLCKKIPIEETDEDEEIMVDIKYEEDMLDEKGILASVEENEDSQPSWKGEFEDVRINQFLVKEYLGGGVEARVHLGVNTDTSEQCAIRILVNKSCQRRIGRGASLHDHKELGIVAKEVAIMKKLEHPNIVQLYEVLDDEVINL